MMPTKLFLCIALCSCVPGCAGLLDGFDQVRSVHDKLNQASSPVAVGVKPSTPNLTSEATDRALSALRESDKLHARDAEDAGTDAQ